MPFLICCFCAAWWCNVVQHTKPRGFAPCLDQDAKHRRPGYPVLHGHLLHSRLIFIRPSRIWPKRRRFLSHGLFVTQPKNISLNSGRCSRGRKCARNPQIAAGKFYEFFAGGGMARAGLGPTWTCLLSNDIDEKKGAAYQQNWGSKELKIEDVAASRTKICLA